MEEDQGAKRRTETKTEPETDESRHKEERNKKKEMKRDCQTFGNGKGSLHVLTCGL